MRRVSFAGADSLGLGVVATAGGIVVAQSSDGGADPRDSRGGARSCFAATTIHETLEQIPKVEIVGYIALRKSTSLHDELVENERTAPVPFLSPREARPRMHRERSGERTKPSC